MTLEFTEQDLSKLNEFIQVTPFKYAYPLFTFFQAKVNEAQKLEEAKKQTIKPEEDGN